MWTKVIEHSSVICVLILHTQQGMIFFFTFFFEDCNPVHVVLVSLLVDQLSGLFLTFFGRPKKIVQSQGIFGQSLNFFWSGSDFLVY